MQHRQTSAETSVIRKNFETGYNLEVMRGWNPRDVVLFVLLVSYSLCIKNALSVSSFPSLMESKNRRINTDDLKKEVVGAEALSSDFLKK